MTINFLLTWHTPVALLPVVAFLVALVLFDSFKLVSIHRILSVIFIGALMAGLSYLANTAVYERSNIDFLALTRYVSPCIEELLKGLMVVYFVRSRRVGLLVDALIIGFALGAGFALVENSFYLAERSQVVLLVQVIRGFGTAIMHGGTTGLFAMVSVALFDRQPDRGLIIFLPGFLFAVMVHSAFNHLLIQPIIATAVMLVVLPGSLYFAFKHSEQGLRDWMESDLDAKLGLLKAINSGQFLATPAGVYLQALRDRFDDETIVDLFCYLRLHGELALRAKGLLLMREAGFRDLPLDDQTRRSLTELTQLERILGKTALLALRPILAVTGKDFWQLTLFKHGSATKR
jgi:RsiW-degrading membrane proteinase PrsW (M82 family)